MDEVLETIHAGTLADMRARGYFRKGVRAPMKKLDSGHRTVHHAGMSEMRIRGVDSAVLKELRKIALDREISLNSLVKEILADFAAKTTGKKPA